MSYRVEFSELADNKLQKLEPKISKRILRKLKDVKGFPEHFLEPLTEANAYKLRVGDYRIIIDFDRKNKVLWILTLGHRKKIYKDLNKFGV